MSSNETVEFLSLRSQKAILKSYHFWIILVISAILIIMYLRWPWRQWLFIDSPWDLFPWLVYLEELAFIEVKYRIIGSLFLLPILYAALAFRWRAVYIIFLLCMASITPFLARGLWISLNSWFINMSVLLIPMIIAVAVKIEFQRRQQERFNAAETERERQVYFSKILEAQEKERQRIARDLHDETLQNMVAIVKRAEACVSDNNDNGNIIWIKDTALKTVDELRRISLDLRPSILDDMGLVPALRWLINNINKDFSINIMFEVLGSERGFSSNSEITILRVLQEALNNIREHSKATEVNVLLNFAADSLHIEIQDNGTGFILPTKLTAFASDNKLGIIGMHERIISLGGTFEIVSKPGEGTAISAQVNY